MAIRNNHWYNLNEQRDYPVDDTASAISDDGLRLPSSLIADLRLRWPSTLGDYAYISAAAVTPGLVTVMIEVSETLHNSNTSTLIAGISVPKLGLIQGRTYILETFADNVGGFITFGSGSEENFSGKFSSANQTLLTARAARQIRRPPVPSMQVSQSATKLTGLVNLEASSPLVLSKETRVIEGVEFDNVVVFKLQQELNTATGESVFAKFAGDCGRRTGSRTCPDPQPLETINGITPDCDGFITLDFKGCSVVGRNTSDCGVVLDCGLGLSESCEPAPLPNLVTGELPSEVDPVIIPPTPPPEPPVNPDISISESATTVLTFPYCDTFDDGVAYDFNAVGESLFGFIADESPSEFVCCQGAASLPGGGCDESQSVSGGFEIIEVASSYGTVTRASGSRKNISLFTGDVQCLYREYQTHLKIVNPDPGVADYYWANGGILINYRTTSSGVANYHLAQLDVSNSKFGIYFFNGVSNVPVLEVDVNDVRQDDWYEISFQADPQSYTSVRLTAILNGVTDPSISVSMDTLVSTSQFGEDSGNAGLHSNRSNTYFSFWRIDASL